MFISLGSLGCFFCFWLKGIAYEYGVFISFYGTD